MSDGGSAGARFPTRQKGLIELKLGQAGYARIDRNGQQVFVKIFEGSWGRRLGVVRLVSVEPDSVEVIAHTEPDATRIFARAWYELLGSPDHEEGGQILRADLEKAGFKIPTGDKTEQPASNLATGPARHRVFISFAIEDVRYRDLLVGQARNDNSPFDFVDMSVKEPWDEKWKMNCRKQIRDCNGVIALISRNTLNASGARWEIQCAIEEHIPVVGMYVSKDDRPPTSPPELAGNQVIDWSWDAIATFLRGL
jgi:hypothetical protein